MAYEILVGLQVSDNDIYSQYRASMKPILSKYHGRFTNDFMVSEVLLSQGSDQINRVFTINFVDQATKEAFFSDSEYLQVKEKFFEQSVTETYILAEYQR